MTATSITVGVISSRSGILAGYFGQFAPGMTAYFEALNAKGGVDGRKVNLAYNLDDGGSPSQFTQLTHTLIDQDHVFAVGAASPFFSPGYFAQSGTPTYGYNVTGNWSPYPNLFAAGGSVQDYSSAVPTYAYFVKATHSKALAFISYGPAIPSSYDACSTAAAGLKAAGVNVSFVDVGAQLGGSFTSDVQRLQQSGSDALISCMQASDNVTLSRDIQQYGLSIKQLWLNGYDQNLLNQYSSVMQGVYMSNAGNVPFGAIAYPSIYPGMAAYTAAMNKYEPPVHDQQRGPVRMAVGRTDGRGDPGGRQEHHPGLRGVGHQQDHRRHRGADPGTDQLDVGPREGHLPGLHRLGAGQGVVVRLGVLVGQAGVRVPQLGRQEPGAGHAAGRHAGGMIRTAVGED